MRHSLVRRASLYRMSAASDGDSSIRSSMLVDPLTDVSEDELAPENIVKIVTLEATDSECNALVWKCLGYALDPETGKYNNDKVFPKWREKYPEPPDLIGLTRNYDPSVDRVVRNASMNLMRSIPRDFKGGVRNLEAYGFKGFKLKELTPNKTRRAQVLLYIC